MSANVSTNRPTNSDFFWVGNSLALDFVNTTIVQQGEVVDLLGTSADLLAWVVDARVFSRGQLASQILKRIDWAGLMRAARTLRAAIRQAAANLAAGRRVSGDTVALLNRLAARPTLRTQLRERRGKLALAKNWIVEEPCDLLRPVALDAMTLLSSPGSSRVRKCVSTECILYFLDTSKSGRRMWCSMATCGNRAKVAEFRRRTAVEDRSE